MFRTVVMIFSGNAAASLLLLARNLLVARLIPVADYGIAATFAIVMSVTEMMSNLGLQQQIVQSKQGDDPHFQSALQAFQVMRGAVASAVLFLMAGPIAHFMGVPDVAWAYQVMALVPLCNALMHFDIYRLHRSMVFLPMALTSVVPSLLSLLVVWPLVVWYGDYRVMLYAILVHISVKVMTSHVVAKRRYRLVVDREIIARSLSFGWPLLIDGILLFAIFNGDKMIVARELGVEDLAIFAMGATLTLTPPLILAWSAQNFFLPQMSKACQATPPDIERFGHIFYVMTQTLLIFGSLLVLGLMIAGGPLVDVLLGEKYAPVVPLLVWMGIAQAVRITRDGPATAALTRGQTRYLMIASIFRVAALPIAWWVAVRTGDMRNIIWVAIAAEYLSLAVSLLLVRGRLGLSLRPLLWPLVSSFAVMVLAGLGAALADHVEPRIYLAIWLLAVLVFAGSVFLMRQFRHYTRQEMPLFKRA